MISGWTVVRTIPDDVRVGLITGQYKLYGSVIRWAAGTPNAGQIVRHLIPGGLNPAGTVPGLNFIPGIIADAKLDDLKAVAQANSSQLMQLSGQISALSKSTQLILQITTSTAMLSGLGLAVSVIGFIAISNKLNKIDERLKEVQKDVQAIKYFLESSERAKLFAALNELAKINSRTASEHRHTILHTARTTLAEINMRYREILSEANTIETAMASEEYFSLTGLALARCTAELNMFDIAHREINEMNRFWQAQARRIAKDILVGQHPERFLATDFAEEVSTAELIQWLDFTFKEKKGLGWIDELRFKFDENWYSRSWFAGGSGLNQGKGIGLEQEKLRLIPTLRKLVARSAIFEGYVAQYELLEEQQIQPSKFEYALSQFPDSSSVSGYIILEPSIASSKQAA